MVLDEFDALLQYDSHKEPTSAIIEAIDRQHGQSIQRVLCSATACDMMSESENAHVNNYLRPGYAHASIDETDRLVTSGMKANTIRVSKTTIHGTLHVPHQRLALDAVRRILNTEPVIHQALIFVDSPRRVDIVIEKVSYYYIISAFVMNQVMVLMFNCCSWLEWASLLPRCTVEVVKKTEQKCQRH